jgi:ribosomal protein S6--L-glutamate ligase
MQVGVVTAYPEEDWHSRQLLAAARRQGRATVIDPGDLAASLARGEMSLRAASRDLRTLDLFLMPRVIGERGDADFQIEIYRLLAELGRPLVNDVDALLAAVDKFRSSLLFERAGLPTPATVIVQRAEEAERTLARWGRAIMKPLYGSLGQGIRLLERGQVSRAELRDLCGRYRALYLQRHVANLERDVRAFVVGDRVIAAIYRYLPEGGIVTNLHRGGRAEPASLPKAMAAIAVRAARAVGLEYTGVDLLEGDEGPLVIEVNGTPRWEGIQRVTGKDVAAEIVQHAMSLAKGRRVPLRGDTTIHARSPRWPTRRVWTRRSEAI